MPHGGHETNIIKSRYGSQLIHVVLQLCSEEYDGLVRWISDEDDVEDVLTRELSLPKLQNEKYAWVIAIVNTRWHILNPTFIA